MQISHLDLKLFEKSILSLLSVYCSLFWCSLLGSLWEPLKGFFSIQISIHPIYRPYEVGSGLDWGNYFNSIWCTFAIITTGTALSYKILPNHLLLNSWLWRFLSKDDSRKSNSSFSMLCWSIFRLIDCHNYHKYGGIQWSTKQSIQEDEESWPKNEAGSCKIEYDKVLLSVL